MTTFSNLQAEVLRNLIDTPTAVQTGVPAYINRAHRMLQIKHNFKVMEAEVDYATVVSTRDLGAVPTDLKEWRNEPFYVWDDGGYTEIELVPNRTTVRRSFENDETGSPKMLLVDEPSDDENALQLEVWPLPDGYSDYTDGEYAIEVPYFKFLPDYAANGDSDWFTTYAEEFLLFYATAEGFFTDWDEQRASIWTQRSSTKFQEAISLDRKYRLSKSDTMIPKWRGSKQRTSRI